ncbi:MAG TPA: ATP-binding protein [Kofleriaceae bacterium]|nr:ATP-binding protein [Kofleriaceae bacterium]
MSSRPDDPTRSSIQDRNLAATGVDVALVRHFETPEEYLREELWRIWLRIEHEIRRRWELQALPPAQHEGGLGMWKPREINGLFQQAHAEYAGAETGAADHGSKEILDAYLRHSALLETRIERTLVRGASLPLIDLVRAFGLDARQRATLTLALAGEIDTNLPVALRYLANDPGLRHVDGRLLSMLVYDSVRARARLARDLSPRSPLVFYRLLEVDESAARHDSILYRRIRPASRLVPYLTGGELELDPELDGVARLVDLAEPGLFPEQVLEIAASALGGHAVLLVVQGQRGIGKRTLLATAAQRAGKRLVVLDAPALASRGAAVTATLHAALRECKLLGATPAIANLDDLPGERTEVPGFVSTLCSMWPGSVGVTIHGDRMPPLRMRPVVHVQLAVPALDARVALWERCLPALPREAAQTLSERYAVTGGVIEMAARAAQATTGQDEPATADLDLAVRQQLYGRLQRLGKPLDTPHTLDDVISDDDTLTALREIVLAISERRRVREEWGFRGAAGISVLFSGSPGVGKTMSATVIANALSLSIYEIDLSQVMSKWVGETEKNLAEVFDAAEPGHVVLLFNEADSLFGKRTADASSANDRYANLEVNYLLQRLERFNGLSILTTNLTKSIDLAFRRRFAYDVQFTFPSVDIRERLWHRAFPPRAATEGIRHRELAERFELSGGYIKVAVERAAFIAAGRQQPITMPILIDTVERMYRERGKLSAMGRLE